MTTSSHHIKPYVGPRPFEQADKERFFGRDRELSELLSLVIASRALLIYAPSGAGKTSLINAGLVPILHNEEFEIFPITRVRGLIPDDFPFEKVKNFYVFNTIISWLGDDANPNLYAQMSLAHFLEAREHLSDSGGFPAPRIIIFDQFEELFTFYGSRWPDRKKFFLQIQEALEQDALLRVVFVMREDYIASLDPYVSLLPEKLRVRYHLERLRRDTAIAAITGPLKGTGISFGNGVVDTLVDDLMHIREEDLFNGSGEKAGEFVEPVQLQVVCQTLWNSLPVDVSIIEHRHIAGLSDSALSQYYERAIGVAINQTKVRERELRRWFEKRLITPAGTRGMVFRGGEETGGIPNRAIDALEDLHLIRPEQRAGARWYELTHDRFIGPIEESNTFWKEQQAEKLGRKWRWAVSLGLMISLISLLSLLWISSRLQRSQEQLVDTVNQQGEALSTTEEQLEQAESALKEAQATVITAASQLTTATNQLTTAKGRLTTAEKELRRAISNKLALQSTLQIDEHLDLGLLLAAMAYKLNDTWETQNKLLNNLHSNPHVITFLHGNGQGDHTTPCLDASRVNDLLVSVDNRILVSNVENGQLCIWNLETGQVVERIDHTSIDMPILSMAISPNSQLLALGNTDNTIRLWDIPAAQFLDAPLIGHSAPVLSMDFSTDGQKLVSGDDSGVVIVWHLDDSQWSATELGSHEFPIADIAFNADDSQLTSVSDEGKISLWTVTTGELTSNHDSLSQNGNVSKVVLSPDGAQAALIRDSTALSVDITAALSVDIAKVATGEKIATIPVEQGSLISNMAFSPDSQIIALGTERGNIHLWNLSANVAIASLKAQASAISNLIFDDQGQILIAGDNDGQIVMWSSSPLPRITSVWSNCLENEGNTTFGPDGKLYVIDNQTHSIVPCGIDTDSLSFDLKSQELEHVEVVAYSSDGQMLAIGGYQNLSSITRTHSKIVLWDLQANASVESISTSNKTLLRSIAFSHDGNWLASGYEDGVIELWDIASSSYLGSPIGYDGDVLNLAFSSDDRKLLSVDATGKLWIWDIGFVSPQASVMWEQADLKDYIESRIPEPTKILPDNSRNILSVAFDSDKQVVALGDDSGSILLWDIERGQIGLELQIHQNRDDRRNLVQKLDSGRSGHDNSNKEQDILSILNLAFDPVQKNRLLSQSKDGTILLWNLDPESWVQQVCDITNRNLTKEEWAQFIGKDIDYDPQAVCPLRSARSQTEPGQRQPINFY